MNRKRSIVLGIVCLGLIYVIGGPHLNKSQLRLQAGNTQTPADFGLAFETVRFPARGDEVEIAAWWVAAADTDRVVVLVHGGSSNKQMQWARGLGLARDLVAAGYSVLIPDMRNHGESGSTSLVSFGREESGDILGGIDFISDRNPSSRFVAIGFSMGGATALYAAAREPRIEAVVTAGTSYDFWEPLIRVTSAAGGIPQFLVPPLLWSGELQGVLSVPRTIGEDISAIGHRPALFIQNEADLIVPIDHVHKFGQALPNASVWVTAAPASDDPFWDDESPFGAHVRSYMLYPEEFMARITETFDVGLLPPSSPSDF